VSSLSYIRDVQYRDDRNLTARQSLYRFQEPRLDIWARILEAGRFTGDESVVDVGCGNGLYLGAMHARGHRGVVCGIDLAPGMLPAVAGRAPDARLLVGDAQRLPFPDASFDRALALHMLYHVPDRSRAIAELRRVTRADGCAVVVTNSERHLHELDDIIANATLAATGVAVRPMEQSMRRFSVESAPAELREHFDDVEFYALASRLRITEVEPVVAYVRSMKRFVANPELEHSAAVLASVEEQTRATIERDGVLPASTVVGCFVCR
jgi:ubiquinone/menaquinone biosynthesis C-methylase UbiE